jgi:uroporphyrinogen-III synthase
VGPQTAGAIERCGWTVGLQAVGAGHESSAGGLAAMILQHFAGSGAPSVLFPRAAEARPTLLDILRGAGITVDDVVAYRMVEASPESLRPAVAQLRAGAVDLVPFGSPRTVAVFLGALRAAGADPAALLGSVRVGAMGATTAAALEAEGVRVDGVGREGRYTALVSELMGDVLPSAAKE